MIYNVVAISAIQQSDSVIHIYTFFFKIFFSIMVDHRILNIVPYAIQNLPANVGHVGLIPGSGRSPGGGNGCLLQCFCLENPMERGA